jgi:hypothetical protein
MDHLVEAIKIIVEEGFGIYEGGRQLGAALEYDGEDPPGQKWYMIYKRDRTQLEFTDLDEAIKKFLE